MSDAPRFDDQRFDGAAPADEAARLGRLLDEVTELTGCPHVAVRCDTATLETVYVEREGDAVVLNDRGETWFDIVQHPHRQLAWNEPVVRRLAAAAGVDVRVERWNGDHGDMVGVRLARYVEPGDRLADLVASFADLVESIFEHHATDHVDLSLVGTEAVAMTDPSYGGRPEQAQP